MRLSKQMKQALKQIEAHGFLSVGDLVDVLGHAESSVRARIRNAHKAGWVVGAACPGAAVQYGLTDAGRAAIQ